jgi:hypothetical protein
LLLLGPDREVEPQRKDMIPPEVDARQGTLPQKTPMSLWKHAAVMRRELRTMALRHEAVVRQGHHLRMDLIHAVAGRHDLRKMVLKQEAVGLPGLL